MERRTATRGVVPALRTGIVFAVWAAAAPLAPAGDLTLSGSNELQWRVRATEATDDQDLRDTLVLDGRGERYGFHLHGGLLHDLDGPAPETGPERYADLSDTWQDRTHAYLYAAYVDVGGRPAWGRPCLRVGRQWRYRAETIQFDGATLSLWPLQGLELSALGGVPVRLYESSPAGDVLGGLGVRLRPLRWMDLGADALRVHDEREGAVTRNDDLLQASAVLRPTEEVLLRGEASWAEGELRRTSLRGSWDLSALDLHLRGSALRQGVTLDDLVAEVSPYAEVLGPYRPYQSYALSARKGLPAGLSLDLGGTLRYLDRESDESAYNHDFVRYHATLLSEGLWAGIDVEVTAEAWQAEGGGDARTLGASLRRGFRGLRLEAGTDYALYKYDLVTGQERERVRTWFFRAASAPDRPWGLRAGYAVEDAPDAISHIVDLAIRRTF